MFFDSILNFKLIVMSEKKVSGKVLMFTGIVIIVFLVAIFGFIFWEPVPEIIQGEAEATEVRISGKVPGRIERFLVDEGDQVKKGDTVAILDSPEVMAKFNQAQAAEEAAQAMSDKGKELVRNRKRWPSKRGKKHKQLLMWRRSLLTGCRSCLKMMWFQRRNVMRPRPIIRRC